MSGPGPNDFNAESGTIKPGLGSHEPSEAAKAGAAALSAEQAAKEAQIEADKAGLIQLGSELDAREAALEARAAELARKEAELEKLTAPAVPPRGR